MRTLLVLLAACGGAQPGASASSHYTSTEGAIGGLTRDHDSGDPIAKATIHVRAQGQMKPYETVTTREGLFGVDHLKPGQYSLTAIFAGQSVDIENILVRAGEATVVDVTFTLGRPDPIHLDYASAHDSAIDRYHPPHHAPDSALIEGTVTDSGTHARVAGAVVTAVGPLGPERALQTVSDDQGRYKFDLVVPGVYAVSAYYSIGGRGQIEVRRSDIHVDAAEAVVVPLWVETANAQ